MIMPTPNLLFFPPNKKNLKSNRKSIALEFGRISLFYICVHSLHFNVNSIQSWLFMPLSFFPIVKNACFSDCLSENYLVQTVLVT